jgi:hypothetical protein
MPGGGGERLFELAASGRPLVADLDQVRFSASGGASGFAAKPIEQPVSVARKFAPYGEHGFVK